MKQIIMKLYTEIKSWDLRHCMLARYQYIFGLHMELFIAPWFAVTPCVYLVAR